MPYYQPVIDAHKAQPHDWLALVIELCEAVEAEDGAKIPLVTERVVKTVLSRTPPIEDLPPEVFYETMSRLLFLGEQRDFELLVEWYETLTIISRARWDRVTQNWIGVFEFVTQPPAKLSEKALEQHLKRNVAALRIVLAAHVVAVDVEKPSDALPSLTPETASEPRTGFGTSSFNRPTRVTVLENGIAKLVWALMGVYQQLLEAGLQQLASGGRDRGAKLLALRERWIQVMEGTLDPPLSEQEKTSKKLSPARNRLKELRVDLSKIQYGRPPKHRYLDAFLPHDARQFGFMPFDREAQDEPSGKTVWLSDLIRQRWAQLRFFLDEYGEFYAENGSRPGLAKARQEEARKKRFATRRELIDKVEKAARSLRLKSEDDLVSFSCAYYQALLGAGTGQRTHEERSKAWVELLKFLQVYLKTQTVHAEFNLDEAPSYFDRDFPRAVNGGDLLDCGVYAVRWAFIFLSIAPCVSRKSEEAIPAKVSFLLLPVHVGLIIEIDDLPPVSVNNEILMWLTDEQATEWREEWEKAYDTSGADPVDEALLRQKFVEEFAAQGFVRDVDLPLTRHPITGVSVPPKKHEIWKIYERLVVPDSPKMFSRLVDDPRRNEYQFDVRFLEVIDLEKRWYDKTVVPFWNQQCLDLWIGIAPGDDAAREARLKQSAEARKAYGDELAAMLKVVDDSYDAEVRTAKEKLSKELRANLKVLGRKTQRVTTANRLRGSASGIGPVGDVREHLDEIRAGIVSTPKFANPAHALTRLGP